jgi:hypothetical protein
VHSGQVAKVKVLLETRMGNKTVTILRNLEIFGVDMAVLTKDCQKRCVVLFLDLLLNSIDLFSFVSDSLVVYPCPQYLVSPKRRRWCCRATSDSRLKGICTPSVACLGP